MADIFGPVGTKMLDALVLPEPYGPRVASQRRIMAVLSAEIAGVEVERRGRRAQHIATVATARHMIKVVYYTMRDGHARCLDAPPPVAS